MENDETGQQVFDPTEISLSGISMYLDVSKYTTLIHTYMYVSFSWTSQHDIIKNDFGRFLLRNSIITTLMSYLLYSTPRSQTKSENVLITTDDL